MKDVHLILETLFRHVQNLSTDGMQGHVKFQQKDLEAADGHFREACHKVQAVVNLQVGLSLPAEGHEIICNRVCKSVTVSSGLFAFQLLTTHGYIHGCVQFPANLLVCKDMHSMYNCYTVEPGLVSTSAEKALEAHNVCRSLCGFDGAQLLQLLSCGVSGQSVFRANR